MTSVDGAVTAAPWGQADGDGPVVSEVSALSSPVEAYAGSDVPAGRA